MINYYKCCHDNNIDIDKIKIIGLWIIVYSNDYKMYLIKKCSKCNLNDLYSYFDGIGFDSYIKLINICGECELYPFYEEINIDNYGKAKEMILSLVDLHKKSYSFIDFDNEMKSNFYNYYKEKIEQVMNYYLKLQDDIEEMDFIAPPYYLLLNNVSKFYKLLHIAYDKLNYINNLEIIRIREVLLVGDLSLNNFLYGKDKSFISFDNCEKDYIIFDLVSFYKENYCNFDCISLIDIYNSHIHLSDVEFNFFILLIAIPNILKFNKSNFDNTILVRKEINYVDKTLKYILEKDKENQKTN